MSRVYVTTQAQYTRMSRVYVTTQATHTWITRVDVTTQAPHTWITRVDVTTQAPHTWMSRVDVTTQAPHTPVETKASTISSLNLSGWITGNNSFYLIWTEIEIQKNVSKWPNLPVRFLVNIKVLKPK